MATKKGKKNSITMRSSAYLFLITILIIGGVFVVTSFTDKNISTDNSGDETVIITPENGDISYQTEVTTIDENVGTAKKNFPENADNVWAMFLVNSKNPLPKNYDDVVKTKIVHTNYRDYFMDERMADYMIDMIADAKDDGINLDVISAYRTIEYQQDNFDRSVQNRIDTKGMSYEEAYADTLKEVAIPGCSEHNAALAADIMSDEYNSLDDDGFKNTKAYAWLQENAADYGFILSFPEGKEDITGIIYEPWHYRFVGVYFAKELKKLDMCMEEYYEYMGWVDDNGVAIEMTVESNLSVEDASELEINAETTVKNKDNSETQTYTKAETLPEQSAVIVV